MYKKIIYLTLVITLFLTMNMATLSSTALSEKTKFSDVNPQKYYAQAIAYLNGLGVVNGVMADTFRPDDFITQLDAIVIISRVLGYENLAIAYGGYPYGYTRIAGEEKFYIKELGMSDYLRRTHVAEMIYNGISAEALFATGINGNLVNYQKEEGLLYKTRNLTRATGKVVTNYISDLYYPQSDVSDWGVCFILRIRLLFESLSRSSGYRRRHFFRPRRKHRLCSSGR